MKRTIEPHDRPTQWRMHGTFPTPALAAMLFFTAVVQTASAAGPFKLGSQIGGWSSFTMTAADITRDFGTSANGLDCKTIRLGFKASDIAPGATEPASYTWSVADARVDAVLGAGLNIQILANVSPGATPGWMKDANGNPDPVQFAKYFKKVIQHFNQAPYSFGAIKYFECANEPNLVPGIITMPSNNKRMMADHYYLMLKECYTTTSTFRGSTIKVVGGVIAGAPVSNKTNDNDFFDQLWTVKHGYDYMDILSCHIYVRGGDSGGGGYVAPEFRYGGTPPNDRGWLWQNLVDSNAKIAGLRPVWITESSYSSEEGLGVSEAEQATWEVRAAITMLGAPNTMVDRFLQFSAYDPPSSSFYYGFWNGLGGTKKNQFYAWKNMCSVLNDSVTWVQMKRYAFQGTGHPTSSPSTNTTDCSFKWFTANAKIYGWAVWWVPAGGSGNIVVGSTSVPIANGSKIETRLNGTTGVTGWNTVTTNYSGNGTYTVTGVGNKPMYVRVTEP